MRVVTPGTATESGILDPKENNFLAAVSRDATGSTVGLAYVDLSTGDFRATEFSGAGAETRLRDEFGILRAREVLLPRPVSLFPAAGAPELNGLGAVETRLDDWIFHHEFATRLLEEQFRVATLEGFGVTRHLQAVSAAGAIVHYLRETSAIGARGENGAAGRSSSDRASSNGSATAVAGLEHLDTLRYYEQQEALALDQVTVRNLELIEPIRRRFFGHARFARSTKPRPAWARGCCEAGFCVRRLRSLKLKRASTRSSNSARRDRGAR